MKIFLKIFLIFLILIAFFSSVTEVKAETQNETKEDLIITRIAPKETFVNQKIWITIVLENRGNKQKEIVLTERLGEADFERSQAMSIKTEYQEEFWNYEWKIKLAPKQNTPVSYWLVPKKVGSYVIPPAKVTIEGKNFYLKSWGLKVKCLEDGKCDSKIGENYLNCPQDCPTGETEGICDFAKDGKCDPDCQKEADPDCQVSKKKVLFNWVWLISGISILGVLLILKTFVLPRFFWRGKEKQ